MIDSGRPLLELEQLAAWATVRLLLNEPRLQETQGRPQQGRRMKFHLSHLT